MAQASNKTVKAGRFTSYVNFSGEAKNETILLLHGSGPGASAWSNWQFALPFLGDKFHCIAPDFVGFAQSEHPTPPPTGIAAWLVLWKEQIFTLLDELKLEKVHVVGNSLGGAVALHLLVERPELFEKVVLMGPCGAPFKCTREIDLIWGFYENPSAANMAQLIKWFVYDESFLGNQVKQIAENRFQAAMNEDVRRSFSAMFPYPRQRAIDDLEVAASSLRRIKNNVLIIHGRDDAIVPPVTSHYLLNHLGGPVQMHIFGGCSHWTQIEKRDPFNRLVQSFFSGEIQK